MKIDNIKNISPSFNDKFFLDTNIWLYLFFPQHSSVAQNVIKSYTEFFDKVISKACLIVTDMIQMSELVNLILRLEHKTFNKINGEISYKDFRTTDSFQDALGNAKMLTSNIVKLTTLRTGNFNSDELKVIVQQCDRADLNDIYFAHFCVKENAILVTNDFDFNALTTTVQVYSANSKYLVS